MKPTFFHGRVSALHIPRLVGKYLLAIAILVAAADAGAALTIEHVAFNDATHSTVYSESGAVDDGGAIFVFVRNTGPSAESVTNLTVNGTNVASLANFKWWRVWPKVIAPGGIATVSAKVNSTPLREGDAVTLAVQAQSGASATAAATLATPPLRIGSVVPSQDRRTIYLLLRNLDTAALTVQQVWLNDDVTAQCTFVGGAGIEAKRVGIVKVSFAQPQPLLTNFVVRVLAARAGGGTVSVAAPIRLIEPRFPLGHWYSSQYDSMQKLQFARQQHLEMVAGAPNSGSAMNNGARDYHIRSVPFAFIDGTNKAPDAAQVTPNVGNENILAWFLRDEPDINNVASADLVSHTETFQTLDPTHPVYANLASNRKGSEYGQFTDIVGVDHYAAFSAPNIIPGTWVTRKGQLEEALEYVDVLKRNTEPKLMWNWPQGVAVGTWGTQPRDWAIDLQFWMNVMGGSKGLFWFLNREEHVAGNETKFDAMRRCARRLAQVRNLLLYGETMDIVTVSAGAKVKARAIISEDAVVVPVINLDYAIGGLAFSPSYSISAETADVTVPVPAWLLPVAQVYEVGADGRVPAAFTQTGSNVTINVSLGNTYLTCSKIFVIGRHDTNAPGAPDRFGIAEVQTNNAVVLSWREPWDNFGVQGYKVYRNGVLLGDVPAPLFITAPFTPEELAASQFGVRAYDSAGNLSPLMLTPLRLVAPGSVWKFHDSGANLGTAWRAPAYNDAAWSNGPAMLGFGDANGLPPVTTISNRSQTTFYFRRAFTVLDAAAFSALTLRLQRDDGAVIYLNGTELWRDNMPAGTIAFNTPASGTVNGSDESAWWTRTTNAAALITGSNVLAVEVHQINTTSSDVAFDLELAGQSDAPGAPRLGASLGAGQLAFTWPLWTLDATLQAATNLAPPVNWSTAPVTPVLSNGLWRTWIPAGTNGSRFYRLHAP